jgi:hypothetical protein
MNLIFVALLIIVAAGSKIDNFEKDEENPTSRWIEMQPIRRKPASLRRIMAVNCVMEIIFALLGEDLTTIVKCAPSKGWIEVFFRLKLKLVSNGESVEMPVFLWNNSLSLKSIQKSVKFIKFDKKTLKFVPKSKDYELREKRTDLEEKIRKFRSNCPVVWTFAGSLILTPVVIFYLLNLPVIGPLLIYFWILLTCWFGGCTYFLRRPRCYCNLPEHVSNVRALNNLSREESIYKAYSDMKYKKCDSKTVPIENSSLSDKKI